MSDHVLPPESGAVDVDLDSPSPSPLNARHRIEVPEIVVHRPRHLTLVPSAASEVDDKVSAADGDVPLPERDSASAIMRLCALFGAATPEDALPRAEELLRRLKFRDADTGGAFGSSEWGTWDEW